MVWQRGGGAIRTAGGVVNNAGCGTVWEIDTRLNFSVVATCDATNGATPGGLAGHDARLSGIAQSGGAGTIGTIFGLVTDGANFHVPHDFRGNGWIYFGAAKLLFDSAGKLFTEAGCSVNNTRQIIKISKSGGLPVMHGAAGGAAGWTNRFMAAWGGTGWCWRGGGAGVAGRGLAEGRTRPVFPGKKRALPAPCGLPARSYGAPQMTVAP